MSQLIQIKDFIFLALKDGINITDETRKSFLSKTMQDFQGRELDVPTSLALISELEKCPFEKDDFVNGLVPYPETTQDENYVYINPMYSIGSDKIPELLKSAGMKLQRKKHIAYIAPGVDEQEPYKLVKKDGTNFESEVFHGGQTNGLDIQIYDDILALTKDEYQRYLRAKELVNSGKHGQVSGKDLYLWALTETFVERREKIDVVFHEMKHAKNKLILFDATFDRPDLKYSVSDIYKIQMDDELSAKIAEVIEAINTYNKSENKKDLSVFESRLLQELLYDKSVSEREQLLSDTQAIVKMVCDHWNKNFADDYRPQFVNNTVVALRQKPLRNISDTPNDSAYHDIRKLMFNYSVYNPKTGKYVNMDFSEYIPEHVLDAEILQLTQMMYAKEIGDRTKTIDQRATSIKQDLVETAKSEYHELVLGTKYRQKLEELRAQGYDYSAALDFRPNIQIVKENDEILDVATPENVVEQAPQDAPNQSREDVVQPVVEKRGLFKRAKARVADKISAMFGRKRQDDGLDYE